MAGHGATGTERFRIPAGALCVRSELRDRDFDTTDDLAAALGAEDARVLIVPREHSLAESARFAELLRRTDASILLA